MLFFFCGEKVQNQELSGVYLTNSEKNQEQLKIRKNKKNQESLDRLILLPVISRLDIFPLIFGADKVRITKLNLIHKNIRSVQNLYVQELTLMLKNIVQCDIKYNFDFTDKNNNVSFEDLNKHFH